MKKFEIYTDGACANCSVSRNGGWAFVVLESGDLIMSKSGFALDTTNNRMELAAINASLVELPHSSSVTIYTDSQYAMGVLSKRMNASTNFDYIDEFDSIVEASNLNVKFRWVKAHNGDKWNEYVNDLAYKEMSKFDDCAHPPHVKTDYKDVLTRLVESIEKFSMLKREKASPKAIATAKRVYDKAFKRAKESLGY